MKTRAKKIAITAVCTALVLGLTAAFALPVPAANGYVNIGDAAIFITAYLFSPPVALIAGGLGSALADVALGYAAFAAPTLVVKGLEGLVAGVIFALARRIKSRQRVANAPADQKNRNLPLKTVPQNRNLPLKTALTHLLALTLASAVMIAGYFFTTAVIFDGYAAGVATLTPNLLQCAVSAAIAAPVSVALKRVIPSAFF